MAAVATDARTRSRWTRRILLAIGTIAGIIILFYGAILVPWFLKGLFRYGIRYEFKKGSTVGQSFSMEMLDVHRLKPRTGISLSRFPAQAVSVQEHLSSKASERIDSNMSLRTALVKSSRLGNPHSQIWEHVTQSKHFLREMFFVGTLTQKVQARSYLTLLCIIAQNRIETLRRETPDSPSEGSCKSTHAHTGGDVVAIRMSVIVSMG